MFSGLPRQGPGDAESTRRALALVPGIGPATRVLDVGCGTGLQTRVLAQSSPARFLADIVEGLESPGILAI
jgi:ubiquinone/menaquinone biosynthesis C-methylase UbiE